MSNFTDNDDVSLPCDQGMAGDVTSDLASMTLDEMAAQVLAASKAVAA